MTDAEKIAQHIAEKGVTVCPPVGWAAGLPIQPDTGKPPPRAAYGRNYRTTTHAQAVAGGKKSAEMMRQRARERRAVIAAEYVKNPTPETIQRLMAEHKCSRTWMLEMLRQAGHRQRAIYRKPGAVENLRKHLRSAFAKDPTYARIQIMAREYGVTVAAMRKRLQRAGVKDLPEAK